MTLFLTFLISQISVAKHPYFLCNICVNPKIKLKYIKLQICIYMYKQDVKYHANLIFLKHAGSLTLYCSKSGNVKTSKSSISMVSPGSVENLKLK